MNVLKKISNSILSKKLVFLENIFHDNFVAYEKSWKKRENLANGNASNVAECVRKLCTDFGRRKAPSAPYVHYLVKKVKETGIPKIVGTPENIAAVA